MRSRSGGDRRPGYRPGACRPGVGDDGGVSLFGDTAPDLILLAEDEARMLGRSRVEPVHLLLAFARQGQVGDLLGDRGITAGALHAAVVAGDGVGDELVLGRLPRSKASEEVLQRAVGLAAERGERRPGSLHVLLALAGDDRVGAILRDLGVNELGRLVDGREPPRRSLSDEQVRAELVRAALAEQMRPALAPVPAFERFTPDARRAVRAAAETAALLEHRDRPVSPADRVSAGPRQLRRPGAGADLAGRRARSDRRGDRAGVPVRPASLSPGNRHLQPDRSAGGRRGRALGRLPARAPPDQHRTPAARGAR